MTRDKGDLVVKVVNAQAAPARTRIDLGTAAVAPAARLTTLQGEPDAVNTADARPVRPRPSTLRGVAREFTYTFPAHSVTFLRIKAG